MQQQSHEQWSSRWGFMLAAVGSAVGLANIWRFPYSAGVSGGGAFVLIYIAAVVTIVLPLLMAELLVGRRGQASPPIAIAKVAREAGASRNWVAMGHGGIVAAILILAFYSVVGGWALSYVFKLGSGSLSGMAAAVVQAEFDAFTSNAGLLLLGYSVFLGVTVLISAQGIQHGVERTVKLLMPTLFFMLLGMVVYAAVAGDFAAAVRFLFTPDFSAVTPRIVLDAFGQAFFSVSVGLTNLMAYGAYLQRDVSIPRSCIVIVGTDTLVALMAGLAIFPIIFAYNLEPASGPGLVFMTLPLAFGAITGGAILGALFFVLLTFAALTSSICMLEAPVAWLHERRGWRRKQAAIAVGVLVWLLGLLCVFSFNALAGVHPLGDIAYFAGMTFFDLFDFVTTRILAPLIGACIALFVGWALTKHITADELGADGSAVAYSLWRFSLRFLAPVVLTLLCYSLLSSK